MLLKDKIKQESVAALKAGDKKKVEGLRFLVSLLEKKEMQLPAGKMKEEDEMAVLRKELKNKEEARQMFFEAGRKDLVEQTDYEIKLVSVYLPAQMTKEAVEKVVDEVLMVLGGESNFGQIMGQVMAKLKGQADGTLVSKIVGEKLSEKK